MIDGSSYEVATSDIASVSSGRARGSVATEAVRLRKRDDVRCSCAQHTARQYRYPLAVDSGFSPFSSSGFFPDFGLQARS